MGLKERLDKKKRILKARLEHGREITEQRHAQRLREKKEKQKYYEPGTLRYGLVHRQGIVSFMKDVYECRKNKRR